MVGRKNSQSHHCAYDRDVLVLHELAHFFPRSAAEVDAAARADNRSLGLVELFDDLFDLHRVSVDRGLVGADIDGLGILEFADLRLLYVDRDIDEDRALAACTCNMESLLYDPGDIRGPSYDITEFDE